MRKPMKYRTVQFETSAFLPLCTQGAWQRYELSIPEDKYDEIMEKRDKLGDQASQTERWAEFRKYDRQIVKRYQ